MVYSYNIIYNVVTAIHYIMYGSGHSNSTLDKFLFL